MKFKSIVTAGVLSLSVLALAACTAKSGGTSASSSSAASSSEVKKEESTKDVIKKDAGVYLDAILTGRSSGFSNLTGSSVKAWKADRVADYVKSKEKEFTPADDYTIKTSSTSLTPSDILTQFEETRMKVLATIGDQYEITTIEETEDGATVTFKSRGVALLDLSNIINRTKAKLLQGDVFDVKRLEDMGDSDKTVAKKLELANYFLYYYSFGVDNAEFGYIPDQEFQMELTKKDGHYILTNDAYRELSAALFVKQYSKDDSSKSSGSDTKDSSSKAEVSDGSKA